MRTSDSMAEMTSRGRSGETRAASRDRSHALIRDILLAVARREDVAHAEACAALFGLIETSRAILRHLQARVGEHGLSEARFGALLVLWARAPEPLKAAELAYHTGVSRSAMTDIVDQLAAEAWVARDRSEADRRSVRIRITPAGRARLQAALHDFMQGSVELLRGLPEGTAARIGEICRELNARLMESSAAAG